MDKEEIKKEVEKDEKKEKKKIIIIRVIAIIIVLGIILYREVLKYEFKEPELITSYNDKFEMKLKKGWEKTKKGDLNEEADIEIYNKRKNMYLIALMESIKEYDATFQDYVDVSVEGIEEAYNVKINNVNKKGNSRYFCYTFNQEEDNIYMCVYIVQTKNYVGQIAIWSLASNKESVDKEIENGIIESVKEK